MEKKTISNNRISLNISATNNNLKKIDSSKKILTELQNNSFYQNKPSFNSEITPTYIKVISVNEKNSSNKNFQEDNFNKKKNNNNNNKNRKLSFELLLKKNYKDYDLIIDKNEEEHLNNPTNKFLPEEFINDENYKINLFKYLRSNKISDNKTENCKFFNYFNNNDNNDNNKHLSKKFFSLKNKKFYSNQKIFNIKQCFIDSKTKTSIFDNPCVGCKRKDCTMSSFYGNKCEFAMYFDETLVTGYSQEKKT
jgi:hypothetical protein